MREGLPGTRQAGTTRIWPDLATTLVASRWYKAFILGEIQAEVASAVTYTLGANDGTSSVFTLVENNGSMVLSFVEEPAIRPFDEGDD